MSKKDRTGISERHSRLCAGSPCTCTPSFKATVWDARAGKRIIRSFSTITAARQWRQDAYAALRAGTLSADRGPTLEEAAEAWLEAARAGIVRNRSGEAYKPATIRSYEQNLRLRILPVLGGERQPRFRCRSFNATSTGSPLTRWRPRRSGFRSRR
jgi:hypothetical protein